MGYCKEPQKIEMLPCIRANHICFASFINLTTQPQTSSIGANPSHEQQQRDAVTGARPLHAEETSRYIEDETDTTVDIIINTWRLQLHNFIHFPP